MDVRKAALSGFLMPLKVYFLPTAFADSIESLAPDLPGNFNLLRALERIDSPAFQKQLDELAVRCLFCLSWIPFSLGLYKASGGTVSWLGAFKGLLIGTSVCLILSIVFDLAVGIASGAVLITTLGVLFGIDPALPIYLVVVLTAVTAFTNVGINVFLGVTFGIGGSVLLAGLGAKWAVIGFLLTTHLMFVPLYTFLSVIYSTVLRVNQDSSESLWKFSPVRLDEIIIVPLPGLSTFLSELYFSNATTGRSALQEVGSSRIQHNRARAATSRIICAEANLVSSISAIAAFKRVVSWFVDEPELAHQVKTVLPRILEVSQGVDDALASDSPTQRARELRDALDILRTIPLRGELLSDAIVKWSELILAELEETKLDQSRREPIPQPYVRDGRPISPAHRSANAQPFKGRDLLFRQIEQGILNLSGEATTFLLYGQRRTGKTSTLLHLASRLHSDIIPVFIDLQSEKLGGAETVGGLFGGLVDEVRRQAQQQRGVEVVSIDRSDLARLPYETFGNWLDYVESNLAAKTLLLCLDEVEALEEAFSHNRFDRRLLNTIRNIAQHRKRIAVLLSSSRQINELPPHWASALVNTNLISISFLEERDARELIQRPIPDFPEIYAQAAIDQIVALTHRQPFLVQLMCALLVDRMNAQHRNIPESKVTKSDVDSVVPSLLERGNVYFSDLWQTQAGSDVGRMVLSEIAKARGSRVNRTSVRKIGADEDQLRDAIQTLIRREIIEHTDDGGFQIVVPLVARYVRLQDVI